ncbi:hypothetical protein MRY87_04225 [bacterium]|nr:hypothetical protein [bacterium]
MLRSFLIFFSVNLIVRVVLTAPLSFLNEDAALILTARESLLSDGPLHWFLNGYGPSIIRPFQLLSFGLVALLSTDPLPFFLVQVCLLSLAQLALASVLMRWSSPTLARWGALSLSFTRGAAESTFWLSSQHDLFLLFFASLSALALFRGGEQRGLPRKLLFLLLGSIAVWGALYSNEKAVTLPLVLGVFVLTGKTSFSEKGVALVVLALHLAGYFLLRFAVLGTFIGGYNDTPFPVEHLEFSFLSSWALSTITALFWQGSSTTAFLFVGFGGLVALFLIALTCSTNRGHFLKMGALWLLVHLLVSLPTAQYALSPVHNGVFSSRMYWMPVISTACGMTLLLEQLRRAHISRGLFVLFPCCLSLPLLIAGVNTARDFSAAMRFTDEATLAFQAQCHCSRPRTPQTSGLPQHRATVNVFTESSWIEYRDLLERGKRCSDPKESCSILFLPRREKLSTAVGQTSPSVLRAILPPERQQLELPHLPHGEQCLIPSLRTRKREGEKRKILSLREVPTAHCTQWRQQLEYVLLFSRGIPIAAQPTGEVGVTPAGTRIRFLLARDERGAEPSPDLRVGGVWNGTVFEFYPVDPESEDRKDRG